jgi:arabinofuranosyltransferase
MSTAADRFFRVLIVLVAALALFEGWRVFWFLCDDAYIAFRYDSNSLFGWGYTWNPPPFRPVEGYTSFLWVVILDYVWRWLGVEPPDSSNWISLGFSFGSLGIITASTLRLPLSERLERFRTAILAVVLLSTVSNRTFLAWTSSGLETAMDTFLVLLWFHVATFEKPGRAWLAGLVGIAAAMELCRPDGLLYLALTGIIGLWQLRIARRDGGIRALDLAPALPVLIPLVHEVWRYGRYGQLLPNTYYAKHVGAWPLAGVMYLASFLLEYAYWVLLFAAIAALVEAIRWTRAEGTGWARQHLDDVGVVRAIGVGAVLFHFLYYTFNVGGDHFEYRVYQHLVPLVPLALIWLLDRVWATSAPRVFGLLAMMTLVGWVIPWMHWYYTKDLMHREQTFMLRYKIAPHLPLPVRWYGEGWDLLQDWLIGHFVGSRHQGHKVFLFYQEAKYPTREEGLKIDGDGFPVYTEVSVGIPGWVFPKVAIIDKLGLNDIVVAHARPAHSSQLDRVMAHDRMPPKGYVPCFRPNVVVQDAHATVTPRAEPLTAEQIVDCETRFLAAVQAGDVPLDRPDKKPKPKPKPKPAPPAPP